mmetsp:Transcript_25366/g.39910  ORF Transcript_25366/g.39910 Transcript_25366/m.39910 type:complete len:88 (+) Transcript_25366:152-415(+)
MFLTTVGLYALLVQLTEGGTFRGSASKYRYSNNNHEVVATAADRGDDRLDDAKRRLRLVDVSADEDSVIADVVATIVSDGPAGYCNW